MDYTVPHTFVTAIMAATSDLAVYLKESVVCGHHVFKLVWVTVYGEVLSVDRESGNTEDQFAVAVRKDNTVVGHIPHKYLKVYAGTF